MIQFITSHPWLLALLGVPALLAALPGIIRKLEVQALHKLIDQGDEIDHQAIRDTIAVWVQWAEKKYGADKGPVKFAAVDALIAKALPFMSADDRKKLIEDVVKALDEGAREATQAPPPESHQ